MQPILEFNNLTKYYGKARGIKNVNLAVNEGEIFGFIGPNGAGKSTTIRLMMGLIFPTSGSCHVFGKDCIKYGPEVRKDVGYLPSEVFYYEKMKVRELLTYSAGFYKKDCRARLKELADTMELDLDRRIEDLSYGNKKKVGIVQGLLHEPKLIVLDEPTSGLDPLMQKKFFDIIQQENKKGATIFFSSHILSEVQELCNRVAIIKEGEIIRTDDIKTLRENNYKKVRLTGAGFEWNQLEKDTVTQKIEEDGKIKFYYNGDMNALMHMISRAKVEDVLIEDPTLEEIFMHYYA